MAAATFALTPELEESIQLEGKLKVLQQKLHSKDLESALVESLTLANYIADALNDPGSKLLIEKDGKYLRVTPKVR